MKNAIKLFSALGERLRTFGCDDTSRRVIAQACTENGWFTPDDIRRAVKALCDEMLQEETLGRWLELYPTLPVAKPRRVLVIMAGNIPLVGFFDLLCVVASGHRCLVKPSAKDSALMLHVIGQLLDIDPETAVEQYDGTAPVDAVIATGSDNANRYFRARYAGIPALLRGSRQSVAVLSGSGSAAQLAGLADDIWAYSGLGCRNVSLLFLPEGYTPQLHTPPMHPGYRNNCRQARALLTMQGRTFLDWGDSVAVEQEEFPPMLSQVACAHYRSTDEVAAWLPRHDERIQCVVTECLPHSRRVAFGQAQSPALTDYPDDRDVMAWLAGLG